MTVSNCIKRMSDNKSVIHLDLPAFPSSSTITSSKMQLQRIGSIITGWVGSLQTIIDMPFSKDSSLNRHSQFYLR